MYTGELQQKDLRVWCLLLLKFRGLLSVVSLRGWGFGVYRAVKGSFAVSFQRVPLRLPFRGFLDGLWAPGFGRGQ